MVKHKLETWQHMALEAYMHSIDVKTASFWFGMMDLFYNELRYTK